MIPPASPADPDAPRPLPRRRLPAPARANRPRFQPLDALWMAALTALALAILAKTEGLGTSHAAGSLSAAGTVALLYLTGWRARDRATGVSAGLLAATSLPFLQTAAYSPQSASFMLLTVAALFAFIAGSSLAALGLAAAATLIRPDGLLLGLLLLGLSLAQGRRRAVYGAALFIVPLLIFWSAQVAIGHARLSLPALCFEAGPWLWLWTPAAALLLWLLLPFCAELSEPMRRARWLPIVLWTILGLAADSFLSLTNPEAMWLPLMPLLFLLAGGGLSRLLPTLAGEFPQLGLRYALAILAVLLLVTLHVRLELLPLSTSAAYAHRNH